MYEGWAITMLEAFTYFRKNTEWYFHIVGDAFNLGGNRSDIKLESCHAPLFILIAVSISANKSIIDTKNGNVESVKTEMWLERNWNIMTASLRKKTNFYVWEKLILRILEECKRITKNNWTNMLWKKQVIDKKIFVFKKARLRFLCFYWSLLPPLRCILVLGGLRTAWGKWKCV